MSIVDDLKSLDPNDPGRWPFPVRAGAVALCFVVLAAVLFYFLVWSDQKPILDQQSRRRAGPAQHLQGQALEGRESRGLPAAARGHRAFVRRLAAPAAGQNRGAEPAGGHLAGRCRRGPRREALPALAGSEEGFLCRASDQDQVDGLVSPDGRVRERNCRPAAHRHVARNFDQAGQQGHVRQALIRADRENFPLPG